MRKVIFSEGEYYHIFNRGVDKRDIFMEQFDIKRFLESISEFNSLAPIGSLYEKTRVNKFGSPTPKKTEAAQAREPRLVEMICYCLNPNHYHLLVKQVSERGVQKFMQKVGTGYTNYFNEKYRRSGALFQGKYKAVHVKNNEQLLHTSVYVNLNNKFGSPTPTLSASSWQEYSNPPARSGGGAGLCARETILEQFRNPAAYVSFAESSLGQIMERKRQEKELAHFWESDSQIRKMGV
jgi:putative transposase